MDKCYGAIYAWLGAQLPLRSHHSTEQPKNPVLCAVDVDVNNTKKIQKNTNLSPRKLHFAHYNFYNYAKINLDIGKGLLY